MASGNASGGGRRDDVVDDVVVILNEEHDRMRALLNQLLEALDPAFDVGAAAEPFRELVRLLVAHETAEEIVVYPVVKADLQAAGVAGARLAEEDGAKRMLAKLDRMAEAFFGFPRLLGEFAEALLTHAEHEEEQIFPLLEGRLDAARRRQMAADFRAAEAKAPTHPHPHGPESSAGNALLGPVLATIDRFRDARAR
jgi:hemerythrin superfamily protein